MKKLFLLTAAAVLPVISGGAHADSINFNGTLSSSSTPVSVAWCSGGDTMFVTPFTVSQTGTYSFTNLTASGNFFAQINLTPDNSYTPHINADTYGTSPVAASPSGTLTAGTTYYFVGVSACSTLPITYSVDLSGSGTISVGGTPTPVPTLSEWGMIILASLLAGGAVLGMRRRND